MTILEAAHLEAAYSFCRATTYRDGEATFEIRMFPPVGANGYGRIFAVWSWHGMHREQGLTGNLAEHKDQISTLRMLLGQCVSRILEDAERGAPN